MMLERHMDEARKNAIDLLSDLMKEESYIERAVLIDDLFGSLRVVVWTKNEAPSDHIQKLIDEQIAKISAPFWTGEIFFASTGTDVDKLFYDSAWKEGRPANPEDTLEDSEKPFKMTKFVHTLFKGYLK